MIRPSSRLLLLVGVCIGSFALHCPAQSPVDASRLRGKILSGYQGWFRTPEDGQNNGWLHWSRDRKSITPETVSVEMWPDMTDYSQEEKYAAPGFTHPDGSQAHLFSSANARTVLRHFEWMRDYGLDGVWFQHFVVDFPQAPGRALHPSRMQVMRHVSKAAQQTGRVWALTFDMTGMHPSKVYDLVVSEWKNIVDEGLIKDGRYLHQDGKPVLMLFGFYSRSPVNAMTPEVASQLLDFFKTPGPYQAFLGGAGEWYWRKNENPEWQKIFRRFDAWSPWNPGNYGKNEAGEKKAATHYWKEDKKACDENGVLWIPTLYPGFGWDNLKKKHPGDTGIPRRGGNFLWEQLHALSETGTDSAMIAMFDEVDEGTAIFKVTSQPPVQASFATYEGLPSDWYLRLVGEATQLLRNKQPVPATIPLKP